MWPLTVDEVCAVWYLAVWVLFCLDSGITMLCSQCSGVVGESYACRDGLYVCESCEWPEQLTPAEKAIQVLEEFPGQGIGPASSAPLTGGDIWRRWEELMGCKGRDAERQLANVRHPRLEHVKRADNHTIVRLRSTKDTTQGFTDDTFIGPPYPEHPELELQRASAKTAARLEEHGRPKGRKVSKKYKEPRKVIRRPHVQWHRCECGEWVQMTLHEEHQAWFSDGARGTLFGRCWCATCNVGHNGSKLLPMNLPTKAIFTAAESAELREGMERAMAHPDGATLAVALGTVVPVRDGRKITVHKVKAIFRVQRGQARWLVRALKPADKIKIEPQLAAFEALGS